MKKIGLFLDSEPHSGGKFQYSQSLLDAVIALPKEQFSVVIAYSNPYWQSYLSQYHIQATYISEKIWKWFFERIWRNIGFPVELWRRLCLKFVPSAKLILAEKCSLWIFSTETTLIYQFPLPGLVPIFDLMHRYEAHFPEVSSYGRAKRRDRHFKHIGNYAKGILVDSEIGKQQVAESYRIDKKRIHVLPYIAPKYLYDHQPSDNGEFGVNLPLKFIFYPAQFWEHKNHKRLIHAVNLLKQELSDLKLVLVGSKKNAYDSVQKLVYDLNLTDNVIFLGYVPDNCMLELYRRARALIMPTFFGPTNIPPLEAFVTGCPAAVSNIYGMPDQVGDAALLFNPLSETEIAEAIKKLWIDDALCASLASKGFIKAAGWSQPQFNQRVKEIIWSILEDDNYPH